MKATIVLASLPLAFSLPTLTPSGDAQVSKRADVSFAKSLSPFPFHGDQCGQSTFERTDDSDAQLMNIDDCNDLVNGLAGSDRHWELSNRGGGSFINNWLDLTWAGNCHFYVNTKDFLEFTTDGRNYLGTSDVADVVRDAVAQFQQWGTVTYPGGSTQVGTVLPVSGKM
ncbi:hypothetical protein QQX98_006353 [Neonectria punicea]|uniref:Ecp2 effector protein-like domain-containing protein n=1 Tax=Neonectria punicea TaxID=979145 RepID=A0ABR1H196_9HYPO